MVTALTAFALVFVAIACSDQPSSTVDRTEFAASMVERFAATEAQARCITDYVFDDYDAAEIEVLVDEGMGALPQARWSGYLNAAAACITHDQPIEGSE